MAVSSRLKVDPIIDLEKLNKDISYSLTDLSGAMVEHSSLFIHYGVLAAKASRQVDNVKMLLEVCEAKVYRKLRDAAVKEGSKVTEAQLGQSVAQNTEVVGIRRALNEAKQIEATAKTAVEGFRHRRDMLVQQGLLAREEIRGEVSIARRDAADDQIETMKERALKRLSGSE